MNFKFTKEHVLLIVIVLLLLTNFLSILEAQKNFRVASSVVNSWLAREEYLISICEIDYNVFLVREKEELFADLNEYVFGVGVK